MSALKTEEAFAAGSDHSCQDAVLTMTLNRLLEPLTRLCLANGVTFAVVEELLKRAFVQEAKAMQPGAPQHGTVSRVSVATGLCRREVTRLINEGESVRQAKPTIASELFARWMSDPALRDENGVPCVLKRQGAEASFESLAKSITRDIHPRSMLEELVRLGLAEHDAELDTVTLLHDKFVPRKDSAQMLAFLADNVGDHLNAAVANVVSEGGPHLEQAVFADELSKESIEALRPLVKAQWESLRDAMVPEITSLIEADRLAGRHADQRLRIGLYTFTETAQNSELP